MCERCPQNSKEECWEVSLSFLNIIFIKLTILILFQDEIRANVERLKELEKLKPPKKEKTPAEVKAEEVRRRHLAKTWYLAYKCQCRSCLYRYGFIDEGGLLENDYNDV